jgi:hypothetical protein
VNIKPAQPECWKIRQLLRDACSAGDLDSDTHTAVLAAVIILTQVEKISESNETPPVKLSRIRRALGLQPAKRGVKKHRNIWITELVALLMVKQRRDKPTEAIMQEVAYAAGLQHHRSVEKIWAEADALKVLSGCTPRSLNKDEQLVPNMKTVGKQIQNLKILLSS